MTYSIESFGTKASDESVSRLEKSLSIGSLPKDYRRFLLEVNGGHAGDANAFDFYHGGDGSSLDGFYGLNFPEGDSFSLAFSITSYVDRDRVPSGFLPIGGDPFGNQICLAISGDHYGEVWFWDHEEESYDNEEPTMDNMVLIAKSFTDFIDGLYEYEPTEEELKLLEPTPWEKLCDKVRGFFPF